MAWTGINIYLQWAASLAILGWALWFLARKFVYEFVPVASGGNTKTPACGSCNRCSSPKEEPGTSKCTGGKSCC